MPHEIKQDETIVAATNLIDAIKQNNSLSVTLTPSHVRALKILADIFQQATQSPRVEKVSPPRVDVPTPPRVTESTDTTLPIHIKQLKQPHTRITRANKPIVPQPDNIQNESTVEEVPTTNKKITF